MKHELTKNGNLFWGYFERVEDFPTDKELKQGDFLMLYKKEIVKEEMKMRKEEE